MLDLKRTTVGRIFEKPVAVGKSIGAEGRLLMRVFSGGIEYIQESAGGGGEDLVGFSLLSTTTPDEWPVVEEAVVPAALPYTVQLKHGNLVPTIIRIYDVTKGAPDLTDVSPGAPAAPDQYSPVDASGLVSFNAAQKGHSLIIWYRYYPTVLEAKQLWYEGQINRDSYVDYERVGVICGKSIIFTSEYDPLVDWAVGGAFTNHTVPGQLSIGGATTVNGQIISAPTAGDAWVGVEINI